MAKKQTKVEGSYLVASPFRDINNFSKFYEVGDDVSHFSEERLLRLVELGYVEAPKEDAKAKAAAEKAAKEAEAAAQKAKEEEDAKAKAAAEKQ